jgi:uncharacterized cupin superfamily protein
MAAIEAKSLGTPDEVRTPAKSKIDVVHVGATEVGRFTFEPGWKWSECIKPVVNTETCQAEHLGYVLSGQIHVVHDDGTQLDVSAGDAYRIAPGHDAWVVGDEPFVGVEFKSAATYART